MKTYIKFLVNTFFKSFFYVVAIIFCLVFIINLLSELEFFKDVNVGIIFTIYLSLLNSPSMVFEIFPFIFLISTQLFFINLFYEDEIRIFKYSGLKNSKILFIISSTTLITGLIIISLFYNISSNLKKFYLELKSDHTKDDKYLAVINKNGLWIRDKIDNKILIVNSSKINDYFLIDNFITEFDSEYNVKSNIKSEKIEISNKEWLINNAKIYNKNNYKTEKILKITTNFDLERIQGLYSSLTSLNLFELYELRQNYKKLNYSLRQFHISTW